MARKDGKGLLGEFLRKSEISWLAAAKALGVTHPTVIGWVDGSKEPNHVNKLAIEKWTKGYVPYVSWPSSLTEQQKLDEIEPYGAEG